MRWHHACDRADVEAEGSGRGGRRRQRWRVRLCPRQAGHRARQCLRVRLVAPLPWQPLAWGYCGCGAVSSSKE